MQKIKLKNGLTIIYKERETNSVAVEVLVKVGSNNEGVEERGISHFIEHMLFEGTEKRGSSQEIANEIGMLHSKLKFQTYKHYLDMKSICTEEQEEKLIKIFKSMLYKEDSFMSPRHRNGRKGKRPHRHR